MLLEQLRTFYFLWWNKGNIREIKTTLLFACQIKISLKIINKPKFLGVPQNFPYWMGNTKKRIKLKLLVSFPDENLSLKNKSCIIKKMPVTALCFAYWDSYNNYVKIVSTNTCQTKLKKILIKQKCVIRIIFHVNEETCPRPSTVWKVSKYGVISGSKFSIFGPEITLYLDTFHTVIISRINTLDTCQINLLQVFIFMQRIKRSTSSSVFSTYFKITNNVHETWFSKYTFHNRELKHAMWNIWHAWVCSKYSISLLSSNNNLKKGTLRTTCFLNIIKKEQSKALFISCYIIRVQINFSKIYREKFL